MAWAPIPPPPSARYEDAVARARQINRPVGAGQLREYQQAGSGAVPGAASGTAAAVSINSRQTNVPTTAPLQIVQQSPTRAYLLVQNLGAGKVTLGFNTQPQAAGNGGIVLSVNQSIELRSPTTTGEVWAISDTGATVIILEG